MPSNFAAQVADWVAKSKVACEAVFHDAAQSIVEDMQTTRASGGNMPVDTGFLRASLLASSSSMPQIRQDAQPTPGQTYGYESGPVNLVINNTPLGGVVFTGYTANYAAHQEFGTSKMAGRFFVTLASQKWPQFVKAAEQKLAAAMK